MPELSYFVARTYIAVSAIGRKADIVSAPPRATNFPRRAGRKR